MADLQPKLTHKVEALDRLPEQFKDKPNLAALFNIIGNQIQELDNVLIDTLYVLDLDNSVGAQLDLTGKLLGLTRGSGTSDDDYREQLKGQIFINRSDGTETYVSSAFEIIAEASNFTITELGNATTVYEVLEANFNPDNVGNIAGALALGTKLYILTYQDAADAFMLDTGPGLGDVNSLIDGTHASVAEIIEV